MDSPQVNSPPSFSSISENDTEYRRSISPAWPVRSFLLDTGSSISYIMPDGYSGWEKWTELTSVSEAHKSYIIMLPYLASRLDVHCINCTLCESCHISLPDFQKPYIRYWSTGLVVLNDNMEGEMCTQCLPCSECAKANREILNFKRGILEFH